MAGRTMPGALGRAMLAGLVAVAAAGCNGGDVDRAASKGNDVTGAAVASHVYDPAMAPAPTEKAASRDEASAAAEPPAEPRAVPEDPHVLTVDAARCRVFLPGEGWIGVSEFWDVYYREPERLPGTFEHRALRKIALNKADDEPGPGLACIGVQVASGGAGAGSP